MLSGKDGRRKRKPPNSLLRAASQYAFGPSEQLPSAPRLAHTNQAAIANLGSLRSAAIGLHGTAQFFLLLAPFHDAVRPHPFRQHRGSHRDKAYRPPFLFRVGDELAYRHRRQDAQQMIIFIFFRAPRAFDVRFCSSGALALSCGPWSLRLPLPCGTTA